jgi:sec-independent protein translocase protein TatB
MFEVGFGEIALIAVVALLVLGPERLPGVARTVGALVRRARASWQSVRSEIERELAAEDIKKNLDEARRAAADVRSDVQSAASDIEKSSTMPPPGSSSHGGP